jgi:FKBP-type peptidyl-prolyl cis-trans isomerase
MSFDFLDKHIVKKLLIILSLLFIVGCTHDTDTIPVDQTEVDKIPTISFADENQKISYCIGLDHGKTGRLYYQSEQLKGKFNLKELTKGMLDYLLGNPLRIKPQELDSVFNLYLQPNGAVDSSIVSCANGSYAMGINEGNALVASLVARNIDQTVVVDLLAKGIEDGMLNQTPAIPYNEAKIELVAYYASINKQLGQAFLGNNKKRETVFETPSGLQYEIFKKGSGKQPKLFDSVLVHYTGKFIDGRDFESTIPSQKPVKVSLLEVMQGWSEGIQLMKEGGQYRFYIPENLAFGEQGRIDIEPYTTLVYDIELLKVYPQKAN